MRIVKMSLVAAVAVASLSTASLADDMMMSSLKMSGSTDFQWISKTTGDTKENKLTEGTVVVQLSSASEDGMGSVHAKFKAKKDDSVLKLDKAYADYKLGMVNLVAGPKMVFPGNFSDSTIRGLGLSTEVAGFTIGAGVADADTGMEDTEKSVITAKGKVAIADLRFDYKLGNKKTDYLATDVKVKVGPATITGAYAAGMGDNNKDMSLMGADVSVDLGMVTAYGAFSLSGDKGGQVTEAGSSSNALGDISGAWGTKAKAAVVADGDVKAADAVENVGKVTALKFGAKAKVAGIDLQGYYSMATPDGGDAATKLYFGAKKSLNKQSTVNVRYHIATPAKGDAANTIELRLASTF